MRHQSIRQSVRQRLLEDALQFMRTTIRLLGVVRVALLGSFTTKKSKPKDVDWLITVTDEAELAPIARAARRLKGHTQSSNRGADVFVADPKGHYVGHLCPWKLCAPGIHLSCDALHCGRRPFLHDDLESVRLAPELVLHPPSTCFPTSSIVCRDRRISRPFWFMVCRTLGKTGHENRVLSLTYGAGALGISQESPQ